MTDITSTCLDQWAEDARLFAANARTEVEGAMTIIVADFEYAYDRQSYGAYKVAEGADAEPMVRWPFHRVAAASWLVLRFVPDKPLPAIDAPVVLTAECMDEAALVAAFFDALRAEPDALLVSWGGEAKDFAVLRQVAMMQDLLVPLQLRDGNPHCRSRLDLCLATSAAARSVHLPELATAMGIPHKPSPSKDIGRLVEAHNWPQVEEQVLADVVTTCVIALMQLGAAGRIVIDRSATLEALSARLAKAWPHSRFCSHSFAPWVRARVAAAGLRGTVYRAPADAPTLPCRPNSENTGEDRPMT